MNKQIRSKMRSEKTTAITELKKLIKDSEKDIMSRKELFLKAESLNVPSGGHIEDGTITFFVDKLIDGVDAYTKEQVIKELDEIVRVAMSSPFNDLESVLNRRRKELKQK